MNLVKWGAIAIIFAAVYCIGTLILSTMRTARGVNFEEIVGSIKEMFSPVEVPNIYLAGICPYKVE
jgi:hypothetical protein